MNFPTWVGPTNFAICDQVSKAKLHYSELDYSSACDIILGIATAGNLYMSEKAPWSLFKEGGSAAEDAAQVPFTSLRLQ